jgi:hypothetical protein
MSLFAHVLRSFRQQRTEVSCPINQEAGMTSGLDPEDTREALGPVIADILLQHATALPPEEAIALTALIDGHLERVESEAPGERLVGLANELAATCRAMLKRYADLDVPGRAAVVGAVRYFVRAWDAENDLRSPHGLEDDARVINYVIEVTDLNVRVRE